MTIGLFAPRAPKAEDLKLTLRLLPEERATLYTHLKRLRKVAPEEKRVWLGHLIAAVAPLPNRRLAQARVTLRVEQAKWLARFLQARVPTVKVEGERRAMIYLKDSLQHTLAFRHGVFLEC